MLRKSSSKLSGGHLGSEWFWGLTLRMVWFGGLEPGSLDYTLISLRSGSSLNNRIKNPLLSDKQNTGFVAKEITGKCFLSERAADWSCKADACWVVEDDAGMVIQHQNNENPKRISSGDFSLTQRTWFNLVLISALESLCAGSWLNLLCGMAQFCWFIILECISFFLF